MKELSWGSHSRTVPAPPRGELPVVREESFDRHREVHVNWLAFYRSLPPPFQRVLEVETEESGVKVSLARFIGVDGRDVVHALGSTGRVLPLEVWLSLALSWGEAILKVPHGNDGWKTPADLAQLGIDVRGELVLTFDEPNHVVGRAWIDPDSLTLTGGYRRIPESISPEAVRGLPLTEGSRVYSLGIALLGLLEGQKQFAEHESMLAKVSAIAVQGLPWGPPRHPDVSPELEAVMRRATARDLAERTPSLPEFLADLKEAAAVEPANERRMIDVLLGVSPRMQTCLDELKPETLPESWNNGGLQVLQDRLLERLVPLTALPLARR